MANDKVYVTGADGNLHKVTRAFVPEATEVKFSSNVNDYKVQIKVDGKWHSAVLVHYLPDPSLFDNVNIDKAIVEDADGGKHTALLFQAYTGDVTLSSIPTDIYATIDGTTTGEVAMATYIEEWADVKYENNLNVNKVLVKASDNKYHTALIITQIPIE